MHANNSYEHKMKLLGIRSWTQKHQNTRIDKVGSKSEIYKSNEKSKTS